MRRLQKIARSEKTRPGRKSAAGANPAPRRKPHPIVGIGASAGGLEAFRRLLKALPANTGMAFVLVQHLDPKRASMLGRLLSDSTRMPVTDAAEGMAVEPNRVYVIPPNTTLEIRQHVLHLRRRAEAGGRHMPVDDFFLSLADDEANAAIGVVLSGVASDGTIGLKAIKAAGGFTFAQDESAKYDGMPRSAVAAGCVAFVLPPEGIARELVRISRHPHVTRRPSEFAGEAPDVASEELRGIFGLLRGATGIDFSYYKFGTIKRRITRRMILHRIGPLRKYLSHLRENRTELLALYEDILIHVTGFFRDPGTFKELKATTFPKLTRGRPVSEPIRIWVPGCSTGEEVYSIAMVLLEHLDHRAPAPQIQFFATDISDASLAKAREGIYSEAGVAGVSAERLRRFFTRVDRGYQIAKSMREMCVFARQDLAKDPPFSRLDLLSCRNVLIYMGPALQKRVMSVFHYALKPTGFLVLGKSEAMSGFTDWFQPVSRRHRIYGPKPVDNRPVFALPRGTYELDAAEAVKPPAPAEFNVQKEVDRLIVSQYAPAGVVANDRLQIVHFRGDAAPFLAPSPGEASLDLLRMVRPEFALELRVAVQRARKQRVSVRKTGILVKRNGDLYSAGFEVVPVNGGSGEKYYLVLFTDSRIADPGAPASPGAKTSKAQELEFTRLRRELQNAKEYLRSIVEEQEATHEKLKSANEEILSSNEELQSTNEELETAKEELQSTNEELVTINEQLQNRNAELGQLGDDLSNLLSAVNIPIVMLGTDRRIRRYTPLAEKLMNLLPSDVGRSIDNIRPNVVIPDLEALIAEVIDKVRPHALEVADANGRWYSMRLEPYGTTDNRIDGAVMVFVDIDALKRTQSALREQGAFADAIMQSAGAPVMVTDAQGRIAGFNHACELISGYKFAEVKGRSIWDDLLVPRDEVKRAKEIYRKVLPGGAPLRHDSQWIARDGQRRLISWSTAAIVGEGARHMVQIGTDVTEQRRAEAAVQAVLEQSQAQLRMVTARLIGAHEEERGRIGRDLHDNLGQYLAALGLEVEAVQRRLGSADARLGPQLRALRDQVTAVAEELRCTATRLHPPALDEVGLVEALKATARQFTGGRKIPVKFTARDLPAQIPTYISASLYRSVQEALHNVGKHSGAKRATVSIRGRSGMLILTVRDSGRGFDPKRAKGKGLGLVSLEERARLLGGVFSIQSSPGKGVRLEIRIPLPPVSKLAAPPAARGRRSQKA